MLTAWISSLMSLSVTSACVVWRHPTDPGRTPTVMELNTTVHGFMWTSSLCLLAVLQKLEAPPSDISTLNFNTNTMVKVRAVINNSWITAILVFSVFTDILVWLLNLIKTHISHKVKKTKTNEMEFIYITLNWYFFSFPQPNIIFPVGCSGSSVILPTQR